MAKPSVLVTRRWPEAVEAQLARDYDVTLNRRDQPLSASDFRDAIGRFDAVLPTVTDLWPGAEWMEREVYDMLGIRFTGHPDLRRILTWEKYPAHPLRKDYPVKGRGEREDYRVVDRDSA